MKSYGFTLIELTIVMILISIVAGIVYTALPSVYVFQAQGSSNTLKTDLNLTRSLAMAQNEKYRIVIGANSYQIINKQGTPIIHPGTNASAILYPTGITITPTGTIAFDSMGTPFGEGPGPPFSSIYTLTVTSNGISQTVNIYPLTGFVQ